VRSRTALPRSRTIGRRPICASISAGEQAAGAEADDDRAQREACRRVRDELVIRVRRAHHFAAVAGVRERRRLGVEMQPLQDVGLARGAE
jgi:hypothetical protein